MKNLTLCLVALLLLCRGASPDDRVKPVTLTLIVTDHHGNPVTDLRASDLRVEDDTFPQQISELTPEVVQGVPPLVILLDMVDLNFQERGVMAHNVRQSLGRLTGTVPIYVYILDRRSKVFGVVPVSGRAFMVGQGGQDIGPVLDKALGLVSGPRMTDSKVIDLRVSEDYEALVTMSVELSRKPGRKQLVWISQGLPNMLHFPEGWRDLTPQLQALAARFNAANTAFYVMDPTFETGGIFREGSAYVSEGTGGRLISSSDLGKAVSQARQDALAAYSLQYVPPTALAMNGKVRKVKISCDRKDVQLVTQVVYVTNAAL